MVPGSGHFRRGHSSESKAWEEGCPCLPFAGAPALGSRNGRYFSAVPLFRTPRRGCHLVSSASFLPSPFPDVVWDGCARSGLCELLVETNLDNGSFAVGSASLSPYWVCCAVTLKGGNSRAGRAEVRDCKPLTQELTSSTKWARWLCPPGPFCGWWL